MRQSIDLQREEIMINVTGVSASGKSSLMLMIQRMLVDKGFNVETNYLDEETLNDNQLMIRERNVLKLNKKITINEVQASRNFKR